MIWLLSIICSILLSVGLALSDRLDEGTFARNFWIQLLMFFVYNKEMAATSISFIRSIQFEIGVSICISFLLTKRVKKSISAKTIFPLILVILYLLLISFAIDFEILFGPIFLILSVSAAVIAYFIEYGEDILDLDCLVYGMPSDKEMKSKIMLSFIKFSKIFSFLIILLEIILQTIPSAFLIKYLGLIGFTVFDFIYMISSYITGSSSFSLSGIIRQKFCSCVCLSVFTFTDSFLWPLVKYDIIINDLILIFILIVEVIIFELIKNYKFGKLWIGFIFLSYMIGIITIY